MVGSQVFPSRSREALFRLHYTCLLIVSSQPLPHEVVFLLARDRRPAAVQVSVAPYHMGVFYRDTTSVSCLSLDSRAPRLHDVSLSTFETSGT